MKIIQITAVADNDGDCTGVFGLGDDNQLYYWDNTKTEWVLDKAISKPAAF